MLNDAPRCTAYQRALEAATLKDKVVMDVGAGSGFLSVIAAQFGPRRVFAVEGSPALVHIIRQLAIDNAVADRIAIVPRRVEEIASIAELWTYPTVAATCQEGGAAAEEEHPTSAAAAIAVPEQRVDVLVSEWMGFYLVHESMLESVLVARDRFLKPKTDGGLLLPDRAALYMGLCSDPTVWDSLVRRWVTGVHGVRCTALAANKEEAPALVVCQPGATSPATTVPVFDLDLWTVHPEDLRAFHPRVSITMLKDNVPIHGFLFWFDVTFPCGGVVLGTSPNDPATHWKQVVSFFPELMPSVQQLRLDCQVDLVQTGRQYQISVEVLDAAPS